MRLYSVVMALESKIILLYFPIVGLAEPIRYLLAYLGKDYEDRRVGGKEWLAIKQKLNPGGHHVGFFTLPDKVFAVYTTYSWPLYYEKVDSRHVSVAQRLPLRSNQEHPNIVMKFVRCEEQTAWICAAKEHRRRLTATELLDTCPSTPISINDHLSSDYKAILGRARRLVKKRGTHLPVPEIAKSRTRLSLIALLLFSAPWTTWQHW
ncbi:hypothetical protein J6590_073936 [Homalodisca vitripennis]|nr:hypothetical protein J6590_073936 [Homalodisca vitripennis]